jgi:hypothetical protein
VSDLDALETELRRITDRLDTMPIAKAESVVVRCHAVAEFIVEQTRILTDEIPVDAEVPTVGVSALGSQLTVLGQDYIRAASGVPSVDAGIVLETLIALRRDLP